MSRQREFELRLADSLAVIANTDQLLPARDNIYLDRLSARIQAVLNKFLDHGRRAFDNLAGGDLVNQVIWELLDWHPADYAGILATREDWNTQRLTDANPVIG